MKLLYAAYVRMPTEKAHGLQIASMCEALALQQESVELLVPERVNSIRESAREYYGLAATFKITYLATGWTTIGSTWRFLLGELAFARAVARRKDLPMFHALITRSALVAFFVARRVPTFYESHDLSPRSSWSLRFLLRHVRGIISTNRWKAERLAALSGRRVNEILVAPNGYDERLFATRREKGALRQELGLPNERRIVAYTGNLYGWKGVTCLAEVAPRMPETLFIFVGGSGAEAARFKSAYGAVPNIMHVPHQPHARIPLYMQAADVLALPNSASTEESRLATSPLKLFEYLASGTPVVAADLPSVREIADEAMVTFFTPDDVPSLKSAIEKASGAAQKALHAKAKVAQYSWRSRALAVRECIAHTAPTV